MCSSTSACSSASAHTNPFPNRLSRFCPSGRPGVTSHLTGYAFLSPSPKECVTSPDWSNPPYGLWVLFHSCNKLCGQRMIMSFNALTGSGYFSTGAAEERSELPLRTVSMPLRALGTFPPFPLLKFAPRLHFFCHRRPKNGSEMAFLPILRHFPPIRGHFLTLRASPCAQKPPSCSQKQEKPALK